MAGGFLSRIIKITQVMLRNWADFGVWFYIMSGAPVSGASGTGVGVTDFGSEIMDATTGIWWVNIGTISVPNWVPQSGAAVISIAKVVLTSAQIKTLRATPITIVPAAGAGYVNELIGWDAFCKYGGTNVFTNPQDLALKYKDGTTAQISETLTSAGFLDQAASEFETGLVKKQVILAKAGVDNQPIVIHNLGASEITGNAGLDNTITVVIAYRITPITW